MSTADQLVHMKKLANNQKLAASADDAPKCAKATVFSLTAQISAALKNHTRQKRASQLNGDSDSDVNHSDYSSSSDGSSD